MRKASLMLLIIRLTRKNEREKERKKDTLTIHVDDQKEYIED